jgi:hypothetical protein
MARITLLLLLIFFSLSNSAIEKRMEQRKLCSLFKKNSISTPEEAIDFIRENYSEDELAPNEKDFLDMATKGIDWRRARIFKHFLPDYLKKLDNIKNLEVRGFFFRERHFLDRDLLTKHYSKDDLQDLYTTELKEFNTFKQVDQGVHLNNAETFITKTIKLNSYFTEKGLVFEASHTQAERAKSAHFRSPDYLYKKLIPYNQIKNEKSLRKKIANHIQAFKDEMITKNNYAFEKSDGNIDYYLGVAESINIVCTKENSRSISLSRQSTKGTQKEAPKGATPKGPEVKRK